ncbi:MAG: peptide-methionine (R)-S-oxide reductase MsrB [bacterium]|nr:peptide-methionine (R)-S-oxide reductase MsrB [bacterium]
MPKAEKDWKKVLTPEQYRVLREKGTEPAFTGKYYKTQDSGMYVCAACGNKLFSSKAKFESGTGWPSFSDPANLKNVILREDDSSGMVRTEVLCAKCGSHLGHVFDDGPRTLPTGRQASGKRYCINSVCLELKKDKK